jgi:hypothetical protein
MKAGFSDGMKKFMTVDGPWDMYVGNYIAKRLSMYHHTVSLCSYTLCAAMQRHFTSAVIPVLGLQDARKDATRARLERCVNEVNMTCIHLNIVCISVFLRNNTHLQVLVKRNWFSHGSGHVAVAECTGAMQSLIDMLNIISPIVICRSADADAAVASIQGHIFSVESALSQDPSIPPSLSIHFQACLMFIRAMRQLRIIAAKNGVSTLDRDIADETPGAPGAIKATKDTGKLSGSEAFCCEIVLRGRNYIFHGKNVDKTVSLLICTCAVATLLRVICRDVARTNVCEAADVCEASVQQLMVRVGLFDIKYLWREICSNHSEMYSNMHSHVELFLLCSPLH